MALTAGTHLGPYEIVSSLGAGGMGEVYRARDTRLQRDVAVKVLSGEIAADTLERFRREARAAGALNHPHICTIHDIGEYDGRPFLVMELLEGHPLDQRPPEAAPVRDVVQLAIHLADALAVAHARGIVHRDVKPANVFITTRGDAKVLDFGVAMLAGEAGDLDMRTGTDRLTQTGNALGTVAYMAPEQLRGEVIDARADLFALGLVVYEVATGQRAFAAATSGLLIDALLNTPVRPPRQLNPALPGRLEEMLLKLLEKNRDLRYQSATDLLTDLRRLQRDLDTGQLTATAAPAVSDTTSVAVLPFRNMSPDPENEFFCDGLAEDLINALGRVAGLRVASRTSTFRFRSPTIDASAIGEALKVGALVEGSVRRSGHRLRVTAQLVNVRDGYQLWSERYDRQAADVFDIQDDIVSSIVAALAPALLGQAKGAVHRATGNPEAYELCLKGRHYWHQRSPGTLRIAIELFEQAIALDPNYALAYAGLADCHGLLHLYGWVRRADSQPQNEAAVARAMALDPSLAEVQFSKALSVFFFGREWQQAEPYFQAAIAASPRWSLAHVYCGMFLISAQRAEEGAAFIREATTLDPFAPFTHAIGGFMLSRTSHVEEAERMVRRALELQPDYILGSWVLGVMLTRQKRLTEAIDLLERVVKVSRSPIFLGILGQAYGVAGRAAEADALVGELEERQSRGEYVAPFVWLVIHAGRGDRAGIREALQACIAENTAWFTLNVAVSGVLPDVIRGDRELEGLLDQIYGRRVLPNAVDSQGDRGDQGGRR